MFVAEIRSYTYKGTDHDRVAIISTSDPSLCSQDSVVAFIKPRSRYESKDETLARAQRIADLLNKGSI